MVLHSDVCENLKIYFCNIHPTAQHWLPLGQSDQPEHYRCMTCHPPPARAFVAKVYPLVDTHSHALSPTSQSSSVLSIRTQSVIHEYPLHSPITLTYERAACPQCHGRWITEIDQPSGVVIRCWSCRYVMTIDELHESLNRSRQDELEKKKLAKNLSHQGVHQ